MIEQPDGDQLLGRPGPDTGCEGAFPLLPRFAEGALAGEDVEVIYAEVANHLASCPDCREDYHGLLDSLKTFDSGSS